MSSSRVWARWTSSSATTSPSTTRPSPRATPRSLSATRPPSHAPSATGCRRSPSRRCSPPSRRPPPPKPRSTSRRSTWAPCRPSSPRSRTRRPRPCPTTKRESASARPPRRRGGGPPRRRARRRGGAQGCRGSRQEQQQRRWRWRWRRRWRIGRYRRLGAPHGGWRSAGFGWRPRPCSTCSSYHYGVDLANGCGAPIFAAHSGTVDYAGPNGNYGNYIRIQHGGGVATGYAHIVNGGFAVRSGASVSAGQVIAYAGNTGASVGCHLHFEVYINGGYTNPIAFLAARGISV
ncbi:M23 family metallopeptidase [Microbacterium tenebrionis]|uniref:M23 family metallopeptidase n=1 Tax=Microbacterium tenebrionis TaxID=2830665 RepID=UPI0034A26742